MCERFGAPEERGRGPDIHHYIHHWFTLISRDLPIVHWGVQGGTGWSELWFRQAFSDFRRNARVMIEWDCGYCNSWKKIFWSHIDFDSLAIPPSTQYSTHCFHCVNIVLHAALSILRLHWVTRCFVLWSACSAALWQFLPTLNAMFYQNRSM